MSDCMLALGDLSNMDNFWGDGQGVILCQHEGKGFMEDRCERISWHAVGERLETCPIGIKEIRDGTTHQRELIGVLQNVCSVGREKRVILLCRNDIKQESLLAIIKNKGVTDILSVPGRRNASAPSDYLLNACDHERIRLTSIEILEPRTTEKDAVYTLVGARRKK